MRRLSLLEVDEEVAARARHSGVMHTNRLDLEALLVAAQIPQYDEASLAAATPAEIDMFLRYVERDVEFRANLKSTETLLSEKLASAHVRLDAVAADAAKYERQAKFASEHCDLVHHENKEKLLRLREVKAQWTKETLSANRQRDKLVAAMRREKMNYDRLHKLLKL